MFLCIICKLLSSYVQEKIFSKYNVLPYESALYQIKYVVWSTFERTCTYFFGLFGIIFFNVLMCFFIFWLYAYRPSSTVVDCRQPSSSGRLCSTRVWNELPRHVTNFLAVVSRLEDLPLRTVSFTTFYGWRRGSVVSTSVIGWRAFPDLCLIYG